MLKKLHKIRTCLHKKCMLENPHTFLMKTGSKFLDIRQYACEISIQSDEKSDCASESLWFLDVTIILSPLL